MLVFVYVRNVCRKDIDLVHKKLKDLGVEGVRSPIDYHLYVYADVYGVIDNSITLGSILRFSPNIGYRVYTCSKIPRNFHHPQ